MIKQKGMTFIGMLFALAIFLFVGLAVIRSVPVYFEHYSIVQSIKQLSEMSRSQLTGDEYGDTLAMRDALSKRLDINGIYNFKMDQVQFTHGTGNEYVVKLKYTVIRPLFYNISLMYDFDDSINVTPGSGSSE